MLVLVRLLEKIIAHKVRTSLIRIEIISVNKCSAIRKNTKQYTLDVSILCIVGKCQSTMLKGFTCSVEILLNASL